MKEYFKILGLQEGASKEEIQKAYKKLSKELDPKNNDNQDFFIEESEKLDEAYGRLMNSSILSTTTILDKEEKNSINANRNTVSSEKKKYLNRNNFIALLILIVLAQFIYLLGLQPKKRTDQPLKKVQRKKLRRKKLT